MSTRAMVDRTNARHRLGQGAGAGAALGVEVVLYWFYLNGDGAFHWFTHFFAGTSAALAIMAVLVLRRRRPVRLPLLWLIVGHLVAMGPDVLFVHEMAHRRWMDIFVGHNVSHFIPGRNVTWYLVFLACLGAYLWAVGPVVLGHGGTASWAGGGGAVTTSGRMLAHRLVATPRSAAGRRRPTERTGWSAPGGDVVRSGGLAVRTLGDHGPPVVLLHGLGGSERSWGSTYDTLATDRRLIVPGLLGFGRSPHPANGYSPRRPRQRRRGVPRRPRHHRTDHDRRALPRQSRRYPYRCDPPWPGPEHRRVRPPDLSGPPDGETSHRRDQSHGPPGRAPRSAWPHGLRLDVPPPSARGEACRVGSARRTRGHRRGERRPHLGVVLPDDPTGDPRRAGRPLDRIAGHPGSVHRRCRIPTRRPRLTPRARQNTPERHARRLGRRPQTPARTS